MYATVLDGQGRLVTGLGREDFIVEEDGRRQDVQTFAAGDVPLSLAIAVDHSFSITPERLREVTSATQGLISALQPGDGVLLLGIGSGVEVLAPLSIDRRPAFDAVAHLERWGTTPLFDATRQAITAIDGATGRRALVLITDGADRYSDSTAADMVAFARRHDVLVYPVTLGRQPVPVLVELATATGARASTVADLRRLPDVLTGIAAELRAQYLLGYAPAPLEGESETWRAITVRTRTPGLRVRARDGYFASR